MKFSCHLKKPLHISEKNTTISTDVIWKGKIHYPDPDMPEPYEQYAWSAKCIVDGQKYGYFHDDIKTEKEAFISIKQEFTIIKE